MKRFKRIMVGLDGKSTDLTILGHIDKIKNAFGIQKIYFVHIAESLQMKDNSEMIYAEHLAPKDESIARLIEEDLSLTISNLASLDHEIIVKEGFAADQLLKLLKEKQIDLLVLGRKPKPGITYFSRLMANQSPCSIIFVPKSGHSQYKKILVPMDFNEQSGKALEDAFIYKKDHDSTEIIPVHFYQVPAGYSKTGHSFKSAASNIRKKVAERLRLFTKDSSREAFHVVLNEKDNIAKKIFDFSLRKGADLIMIGSRGRTRIASFLKGSVAAKVVEMTYHLPVLIDKTGHKNMDAASAIGQI